MIPIEARVADVENLALRALSIGGAEGASLLLMSAIFSPFTAVAHAQSPFAIQPLQVKFAVDTTGGAVNLTVNPATLPDRFLLIVVDVGEDANVNAITFTPTSGTVQDPSTGAFASSGSITTKGGNAWWQWDKGNNRFVLLAWR